VVEQSFTRRGLASIARNSGPFNATVLVEATRADTTAPTARSSDWNYPSVALPVGYPGSHQTVALAMRAS
jgi:hypothetical protein